jgi:hypothetical protein
MADAVIPRWHGDNYQARVFWENALNLLDDTSCVVEVAFEADGPKAFDDVVVRYDPPVARSGPDRVSAEYHQVKWHVELGGRFGYADFVDPAFIGAKTVSILERLMQARKNAGSGSCFAFITTYRISDGDPLAGLVSGNDKSLLVEKLFDGTTDRSRMGTVRKLWREHLGLPDDASLRAVVSGLRILEGHRSLDELKANISLRAKLVGVITSTDASSDFRLDELARALKRRGLNSFTKETFARLCREEGLLPDVVQKADDAFHAIAIRSFLGPAADIVGARPEDTLLLTDLFRQRYLRADRDWQRDLRPAVETFLRDAVRRSSRLRLILDAHASIAFLGGAVLDLKAGAAVELVQKGRVGSRVWRADDGSERGAAHFEITEDAFGEGAEIAIALSVAQSAKAAARDYCTRFLPNVGKLLSFALPGGPSHQGVLGGGHAAALAESISNRLREAKGGDPDTVAHIFAAAPNALLFYLGQQHQAVAPCVVYEFDFDRQGNKTYQPSMVID